LNSYYYYYYYIESQGERWKQQRYIMFSDQQKEICTSPF